MADVFDFPEGLFGTSKTTRAYWKTVLRAARKAGGWKKLPSPLQMRRYQPGEYIINRVIRFLLEGDRTQWWLNWVGSERTYGTRPSATQILLDRQLLISGLDYLWYAIGVLGEVWPATYYRIQDESDEDRVQSLFYPVAQRLIHWLPELIILSTNLYCAGERESLAKRDRVSWFGNALSLVLMCGFRLDVCEESGAGQLYRDWIEMTESVYGGSIPTMLLANNVIEPSGDRWALRARL